MASCVSVEFQISTGNITWLFNMWLCNTWLYNTWLFITWLFSTCTWKYINCVILVLFPLFNMSVFIVLTFLFLVSSTLGDSCPRCAIYRSNSPYGSNIDTCSSIQHNPSKWRNCYGSKVCKKLVAVWYAPYFGTQTNVQIIDCYYPRDTCWSKLGNPGSGVMTKSCSTQNL